MGEMEFLDGGWDKDDDVFSNDWEAWEDWSLSCALEGFFAHVSIWYSTISAEQLEKKWDWMIGGNITLHKDSVDRYWDFELADDDKERTKPELRDDSRIEQMTIEIVECLREMGRHTTETAHGQLCNQVADYIEKNPPVLGEDPHKEET